MPRRLAYKTFPLPPSIFLGTVSTPNGWWEGTKGRGWGRRMKAGQAAQEIRALRRDDGDLSLA